MSHSAGDTQCTGRTTGRVVLCFLRHRGCPRARGHRCSAPSSRAESSISLACVRPAAGGGGAVYAPRGTLWYGNAIPGCLVLLSCALDVAGSYPPSPLRKHGRGPKSQVKTAVQRPPRA